MQVFAITNGADEGNYPTEFNFRHANNIFKSYLLERQKYTVVNRVSSSLKRVFCGVPQRLVLDPLFSLYINDMYRAVGPEYTRLFRRWHDIIYEPPQPTYTRWNNKT